MLLIDKKFIKIKAMQYGREVKQIIEKHRGNKHYKVEKDHCIVCNESVTKGLYMDWRKQIEIFICKKCIPQKTTEQTIDLNSKITLDKQILLT